MDLLIADPLEPDVLAWLEARHDLLYAPRLVDDPAALTRSMHKARAALLPARVRVDPKALRQAPRLRAIGRIVGGVEHIDYNACTQAGVEVVRCPEATAPAEAEFMLGALLALLRPGPSDTGHSTGRELSRCTVGLIGITAGSLKLAGLLQVFGSQVVGYDPTIHSGDARWTAWGIRPMGLSGLFAACDGVCVQLPGFTRYRGLLGERTLAQCRPGQVLVSTSPSYIFDKSTLARVLDSGRMTAAWMDQAEPDLQSPGKVLHGVRGLLTTPRLAGYTRESRLRSAWGVARRVDHILRHTDTGPRPEPSPAPATHESAETDRPSATIHPLPATWGQPRPQHVKPAADAAAAASPVSR